MGYYLTEITELLNVARKTVADIVLKETIKEGYSFYNSETEEKLLYCSLVTDLHNYLQEYIKFNEVIYENDVRHVITVLTNLLSRYQLNYVLPLPTQRQLAVEEDIIELYPIIEVGDITIEVYKNGNKPLLPSSFGGQTDYVNLFTLSEGETKFNIRYTVDPGQYIVDNISPNKQYYGLIENYKLTSVNINQDVPCNSHLIEVDDLEVDSMKFSIYNELTIGEGDYPVTNLGEPSRFYVNHNGGKIAFPFPANQQKMIISKTFNVEITEPIIATENSIYVYNYLPLHSTWNGQVISFSLATESISLSNRQKFAIPTLIDSPFIITMFSALTNTYIDATELFTNNGVIIFNGNRYIEYEYNQAKHGLTLIKLQF